MPPTLLSPPQSFDDDAWPNATTTTTSAKDCNHHAVVPFALADGEPVTTVAVMPLQAAEANVADVEAPANPAGRVPSFTIRGSARANLRASVADGATWGVMVGAGESYLAAFALAVGMGEISAGLVSSVPLLVGGILQLIAVRGVTWLGSEKRWIVACATLQACSFLPLIIAAVHGSISLPVLLLLASLYWTGGLASGPPWNTWMEQIVPPRIRSRYFALRSRITQLSTLIGLVAAGLLLEWMAGRGQALWGFAALFVTAAGFRFWSVMWLLRHQTPLARRSDLQPTRGGNLSSNAARLRAITGGRLLTYLVVVQAMVQISGPYFAPYMLKQLEFNYHQFVIVLAVGFVAKIVGLWWWGRGRHSGGARRLLWIGGVGIVPLSALWIVSDRFEYLLLVQVASGLMWAAYELGFFLLFFETLPLHKRTRMLTYYNLANMVALCVGACVGAMLLRWCDRGQEGYWLLFGVSSLGRLLALSLLTGITLQAIPVLRIGLRVLGVRLSTSTIDIPILSTSDRPS